MHMANSNSGRRNSAKSDKSTDKSSTAFTQEERAAMRERASELKAEGRISRKDVADGESDVLAKIAAMAELDRVIAQRLHTIVKANAPSLSPKLWYGMPAYANSSGSVICFFQDAKKFKTRYATLGFSDKANLDEGRMWPTAYALKELTAAEEKLIVALLEKAVS
jgi:uncharacterized protein YdhG (YjbR/CyaY superfamily)